MDALRNPFLHDRAGLALSTETGPPDMMSISKLGLQLHHSHLPPSFKCSSTNFVVPLKRVLLLLLILSIMADSVIQLKCYCNVG